VAFTASDLWLSHVSQGFTTIGFDVHFPFKEGEWAFHATIENHVGTGISELNVRNRAGKAKVTGPILGWRSCC
jgi:hypothetical protein